MTGIQWIIGLSVLLNVVSNKFAMLSEFYFSSQPRTKILTSDTSIISEKLLFASASTFLELLTRFDNNASQTVRHAISFIIYSFNSYLAFWNNCLFNKSCLLNAPQGDYLMTVKERDDAIKKVQEEEERKVGDSVLVLS